MPAPAGPDLISLFQLERPGAWLVSGSVISPDAPIGVRTFLFLEGEASTFNTQEEAERFASACAERSPGTQYFVFQAVSVAGANEHSLIRRLG